MTLQTDISTMPSRLLLYCTGPVAAADYFVGMASMAGILPTPEDPSVVQLDVTMPAFSPQNSFNVTLLSKEAIRIKSIKRVY